MSDERFLDREWLLSNWHQPYVALKRGMDIIVACLLFVAFAITLFPIAIAIRLNSRGGVFYFQERIGLNGQSFQLIKYRSMVADAEKHGARFTSQNDARVTRVGAFLRATRFDELPQAINILRGQMSVVGPRPERPHVIEAMAVTYPPFRMRTVVRPGLTGWAQVKGAYAASPRELADKLEYDLYYIRNASIMMDLRTIFATVTVVFQRKGL